MLRFKKFPTTLFFSICFWMLVFDVGNVSMPCTDHQNRSTKFSNQWHESMNAFAQAPAVLQYWARKKGKKVCDRRFRFDSMVTVSLLLLLVFVSHSIDYDEEKMRRWWMIDIVDHRHDRYRNSQKICILLWESICDLRRSITIPLAVVNVVDEVFAIVIKSS